MKNKAKSFKLKTYCFLKMLHCRNEKKGFFQEFVNNKGVDMIIESVGDVNMDKDVKLLAKFGRIMVNSDYFS